MADQTMSQQGSVGTGDSTGGSVPATGQAQNAGITLTPEQQAHVDGIIADRLKRAQAKWETDQKAAADASTADADKKRLTEEKKFQDLAETHRKEAEGAKAKLSTAEETLRRYRLKDAFRLEADKAKAKFANAQAELDAFALLDVTGVKVADDGTVTGIDAALKALQTSRPYLFAKAEGTGASINAADGRGSQPPDTKAREADLKKRFRLG